MNEGFCSLFMRLREREGTEVARVSQNLVALNRLFEFVIEEKIKKQD